MEKEDRGTKYITNGKCIKIGFTDRQLIGRIKSTTCV